MLKKRTLTRTEEPTLQVRTVAIGLDCQVASACPALMHRYIYLYLKPAGRVKK